MAEWGARTEIVDKVKPAHPPFPFEVDYLWGWFNEFTWGLKSNGMGPVMASWGDVIEWCAVADIDPEPWEKKALVRLAHERAAIQSEQQNAARKA